MSDAASPDPRTDSILGAQSALAELWENPLLSVESELLNLSQTSAPAAHLELGFVLEVLPKACYYLNEKDSQTSLRRKTHR